MDCQSGSPLKALITPISEEPTWIARALPRAVPQCGHGWKEPTRRKSWYPRKMPGFPFGALSATCRKFMRERQRI